MEGQEAVEAVAEERDQDLFSKKYQLTISFQAYSILYWTS